MVAVEWTGIDLATEVRQLHPDVPVLLTTGHSGMGTPERTSAAGIQRVLQKPFDRDGLAQALDEILD